MSAISLHFLGTGGGRFVMISQSRRTAGIRLVYGSEQVHIDPGPGALVFSNWAGLSPQRLGAVIVTHCHPDHYCDAEVFLEAMSQGATRRRGILAASRSVLYGEGGLGPSVSSYHQGLVDRVVPLSPGEGFELGELRFQAVEARHGDPQTVGIRVYAPGIGSVGYTSDTEYFPGLGEGYRGVRLLVLCTMRPRGMPLPLHLSVDDALKIIGEAGPSCVVLTHFGMSMLKAGPDAEAAYLEGETGIPSIAAKDGMKIDISDLIEASGPTKKDGKRIIEA
ncbi:MAG: MBL fold metallo-hydrolase [Candidatus Bathyarchaeia archaeon]|nr:MBL fold metallo-hydrolase [Candidatus Bathyarchaeota archaeon]